VEERVKTTEITVLPDWNKKNITLLHLVIINLNILLGILGIVLAEIKYIWDPNCHQAAPAVMFTIGCMTIFSAFLLTVIAILVWLKLSMMRWFPEVLYYTLYAWGYVLCEAGFWAVTGFATALDDCNAYFSFNIALFYYIFWLCLEFVFVVFHIIFYYVWHMPKLYSKKSIDKSNYVTKNNVDNNNVDNDNVNNNVNNNNVNNDNVNNNNVNNNNDNNDNVNNDNVNNDNVNNEDNNDDDDNNNDDNNNGDSDLEYNSNNEYDKYANLWKFSYHWPCPNLMCVKVAI